MRKIAHRENDCWCGGSAAGKLGAFGVIDLFHGTITLASIAHLGFALTAIVAGGAIIFWEKGTALHRLMGRIYVPSMIVLCVSAFGIYDVTGGINVNHIAAAVALALVIAAFSFALFKRPRKSWVRTHALMMLWSYVTLLAFAASQLSANIPAISQILPGLTLPLIVAFLGWFLIWRNLKPVLKKHMIEHD